VTVPVLVVSSSSGDGDECGDGALNGDENIDDPSAPCGDGDTDLRDCGGDTLNDDDNEDDGDALNDGDECGDDALNGVVVSSRSVGGCVCDVTVVSDSGALNDVDDDELEEELEDELEEKGALALPSAPDASD
jgi:hypothetical protein